MTGSVKVQFNTFKYFTYFLRSYFFMQIHLVARVGQVLLMRS